MNYRIPDRVGLLQRENNLLYLINEEIIEFSNCSPEIIQLIKHLKSGDDLTKTIENISQDDLKTLMDILCENNLIRNAWNNEYKSSIVNKQLYYFENICDQNPNEMQKKLDNSRVLILGVGGVGTSIIQHLLGAGIKSFILVDDDVVSLDNLNRQFTYSYSDISRNKVDATRDYIYSVEPSSDVRIHKCKIREENDMSIFDQYEIDFIVNATDSTPQLPMIINSYCKDKNIPFIEISVGVTTGSWGPIISPSKNTCLKCYHEKEEKKMSAEELYIHNNLHSVITGSFGPTNTIISTFAAMDIIYYLSGIHNYCKSLSKRCLFDFQNIEIVIDNSINGDCSCGGEIY
ncbi:HesA/MoeB/ThiF family protein [Priestia megaterium]|uniref:HesA/MoeB/ThiF family protein n=1 Tax=Priestia megaterium TaxID=1404 RepID=UPI000CA35F57|nr:ThiF family adenylyltransferase [Priestia megaterium]AUO14634.1 ThiF family adenylyltransferase [Priestia megaterium]